MFYLKYSSLSIKNILKEKKCILDCFIQQRVQKSPSKLMDKKTL